MTADAVIVHTLGHSRHPLADFVALAHRHGIETVVDVRGQPYSRANPQFNRDAFETALYGAGLGYRWEGERLSGRPKDRRFYGSSGKVLWADLRAWPPVGEGIDEMRDLGGRERIALVCAEEDPVCCHRRILLTSLLEQRGVEVRHIRGDGTVETELEAAARAAGALPGQLDLFG